MHSLSEAERKDILELARCAVVEAVSPGRSPRVVATASLFQESRGVFVTLYVQGKLHGCIGVAQGKERLGESIPRCAASAALNDPRFSPMRPEDLETLEIEVSLLSPLEQIQPEQIEIGKHGLLVEQGTRRGLLLPQVAVEHDLNREDFLKETCHKAGLPKEAWKSAETRIYGFSCEIVSDAKQS
jgi:AmmeMemoRadiSam system protein A